MFILHLFNVGTIELNFLFSHTDDKVEPTKEVTTTRCVKNPNKILVYMYMSPTTAKQKENLRKIAIEKEASEDVEIYVWKMVKGEPALDDYIYIYNPCLKSF